jgi:hypothetical protein
VVSGEWITAHVKPALADGAYIEYATEPSGLGNADGSCEAPFNVLTGAPEVELKPPTSPSNNQTPTFSGATSEKTPVTIEVYEGTQAEGNTVSQAKATVSGGPCSVKAKCTWISTATSPALTSGIVAATTKATARVATPGR